MFRREFLKRMAFAALACGFLEVGGTGPAWGNPWTSFHVDDAGISRLSIEVPRGSDTLEVELPDRNEPRRIRVSRGARRLDIPVLGEQSGRYRWV